MFNLPIYIHEISFTTGAYIVIWIIACYCFLCKNYVLLCRNIFDILFSTALYNVAWITTYYYCFVHKECFSFVSKFPCQYIHDTFSYPAGAAAGYCIWLVSFFLSFFFLSFFFLSFWQHAFFTYFSTSDSDQTWSKWPVPWPLLRLKWWWGQRSRWGHWGQKGHFHQKGIKSYRMRSIDAWLMHMN